MFVSFGLAFMMKTSASPKYAQQRYNLGPCGGGRDTLECQTDVRDVKWTVLRLFLVGH
jgi:hypothetical protein